MAMQKCVCATSKALTVAGPDSRESPSAAQEKLRVIFTGQR